MNQIFSPIYIDKSSRILFLTLYSIIFVQISVSFMDKVDELY